MDDIKIIDTVERYIRGEMKPDERLQFEQLRKANAEVDQLVVEHTLFLQQLNHFGERKSFRSSLNEIHTDLTEQGKIDSMKLKGKAKVVYLWRRYKRVTAIAASIAGITALTISALVWIVAPRSNSKTEALGRELDMVKQQQQAQNTEMRNIKNQINSKPIAFKSGGTGFMIDGRGFIITNAHIIQNSRNIAVVDVKGNQYNATIVQKDNNRDIAIIKIDDKNFTRITTLPYSISKTVSEVAEPIFTLGFPRNDIVYSEGYLSARTGFNGDSLTCQLGIAANRGNSGGPVFNHNGEVIGILSTKETESEGVAFAIQSKYIYDAVKSLNKNSDTLNLTLSSRSSLKGMSKQQQVRSIEKFVFMVKGD